MDILDQSQQNAFEWSTFVLTSGCYKFWPDVNCTGNDFTAYDNGTCYNDTALKGVWDHDVFENFTGIKRISASENYFK